MHRIRTPRFRRSQLAAAVLALAAAGAGHAAPATAQYASASHAAATTTQLPRGVTPLHYILSITPDAAAATFQGAVAIKVAVDAPTSSITFNALNLTFGAAAIEGAGGVVGRGPAHSHRGCAGSRGRCRAMPGGRPHRGSAGAGCGGVAGRGDACRDG